MKASDYEIKAVVLQMYLLNDNYYNPVQQSNSMRSRNEGLLAMRNVHFYHILENEIYLYQNYISGVNFDSVTKK